ncbi:alpha/beta hydrolase [Nannocystis sp. ILAH1]|uniref:alpha/beta fold hydrolase n=1 Tax=unclassified Nannocystis TaxID=2627009 RepID=UPI002271F778|nr:MULTISPECIES: alpha/beta hydrolase [unclassified Nannocystis]MCY0993175.1 alpha/beta hydrolase [Nannocystis sp. ILAH1]MCY1063392.1 alpha/beta hydrolase [Nannocystis sp. RBIL2]
MKVVFCHGLEGSPQGRKAQALRAAGLDLVAPDFTGMNLAARVAGLMPELAAHDGCVLVGSSYGGLTALCGAILHHRAGGRVRGLVLAAPALILSEPPADALELAPPCPTHVIHGRHDELIPVAAIEAWAAAYPAVRLEVVDDAHVLARSLDRIVAAAAEFARD